MQMKTKMIALALLAATSTTYADETQWFEVSVQNASSQGSGVYDICRYDAEGNSYIGWITAC